MLFFLQFQHAEQFTVLYENGDEEHEVDIQRIEPDGAFFTPEIRDLVFRKAAGGRYSASITEISIAQKVNNSNIKHVW